MLTIKPGHWEGLEGLGAEALGELRPSAEAAVVDAAVYFVNELKLTLTGQRHGREYTVRKRATIRKTTGKNAGGLTRTYTASAPGEPPAVLWGNLRNSVGASAPVWSPGMVSVDVGVGLGKPPEPGDPDPGTSYARRLEFGGIDSRGVKIAARPYMVPTETRATPRIEQLLERRVGP